MTPEAGGIYFSAVPQKCEKGDRGYEVGCARTHF